jgi:hypothetical protein
LARHEKEQLDALMLTLRQKLTGADFTDLSGSSRSYLLLVLELSILGWPARLAEPVEAFYSTCLPNQGRSPPMASGEARLGEEVASHRPPVSSVTTDLLIEESPMVESLRQMNLAALAGLCDLQQDDLGGSGHKEMGYDSWSKDSSVTWTPKTYSRPPPPIVNMSVSANRPVSHGSISLNEYSNVRPNNLRR